jgi:hypothetical protein
MVCKIFIYQLARIQLPNLILYSAIRIPTMIPTLYIRIHLAAAISGACQELTSTLREGNHTCQGEEVIFTCKIRSATLSILAVAWSSTEYIGQDGSLQLSTANMVGANETSTGMDGSITATATVTNNTTVNGERILESMLRITAVEASTVTCSSTSGGPASIEFTVSGTYAHLYNVHFYMQYHTLFALLSSRSTLTGVCNYH